MFLHAQKQLRRIALPFLQSSISHHTCVNRGLESSGQTSVESSPSSLFTFCSVALEGCGQREVTLGRGIAVYNLPSSYLAHRPPHPPYKWMSTITVLHSEVCETSSCALASNGQSPHCNLSPLTVASLAAVRRDCKIAKSREQ